MSKTVIDSTTGLPKLPEGDWWEVRKQMKTDYSIGAMSYYTYWSGHYEVVWFTKELKTVYRRKHWWSLWESQIEELQTVEKEKFSVYTKIQGEPVKATKLTTKEIREAANHAYDAVTAREKTENLLGKYPPKKLN